MSVFDIFKRLEAERGGNAQGAVEFIIAGLGNPGTKYEATRHNTGFMVLDELARGLGVELKKLSFKSLTAQAVIGGRKCLLMKPATYMNLSGQAVSEAMSYYKLSPENVLVIYDDISLDVGRMRIRQKGSAGGHNGIKSIILEINSDQFPRIKVGCGQKPHPDFDLADWVTSNFTRQEGEILEKTSLPNAAAAAKLIAEGKINEAMNKYNS